MTSDAATKVTGQTRLPSWLRVSLKGGRERRTVRSILHQTGLHTVCESAQCPNRCECWNRHAATFMIMGNVCTRNCRFCAVLHGTPEPLAADEPRRIAAAAGQLGLKHVVITSVTRDDLADGGAEHFAGVIRALRHEVPTATIEVLTPDFGGSQDSLDAVISARPDIFNHNLECSERLTQAIRSGADYWRSLAVLGYVARQANGQILVKSGFMLGMGEDSDEIHAMLKDLRSAGVSIVTIGQYLPPSDQHWPVAEYVTPEVFARWEEVAKKDYGFVNVLSGPRVRSSYLAEMPALS